MLKLRFIGRGMYLEFHHPTYPRIVTSRVLDIRASEQRVTNARAPIIDRARFQDLPHPQNSPP
jgi:hypothetical protein